ncbi:polymorphic toxin-type HINT domain-containing protein, partial [Micromonospora sp. LOL_021]|uniref:polymorphic toxin-type HINT domain-containing protein n=1 Tax=Micromonospora sp. LOL_021 TaxID=3345417 RepID=UPI003A8BDFE2
MDPADPQQMHGYAYANNNPTTYSDPTGLYITGDNDGHVWSYGKKNGKHVTKNYTPKSASPESYEKVTVVANQNYRVETNGFGQVFLNDYPIPSGGPDAAELVGYLAEHCQGDRWCHGEFHCGNYLSCDQMNTYLDANAVLYQICTKGYCSNDFWEKVADDNIILVGLVHGMFEGLGAVGGGGRRIKTGLPLHSDFRYYLSACKNSFASATLVLMADGSTKKIEQVEVGDMVLATDPETGRTAQKSVTDTITGAGDKSLVAVTIESDKGNPGAEGKTLIATDRHPFWLPKLDKWVDADDLEIGQWLRTSTGTYVQISAISRWVERRTVYNLTVADIHTYYVLADNTPVLVHNCPVAPGGRPGKDFTPAEKRAVWDENGNSYGVNVCERCGVEVSKPRKSERGVTPPTNEGQVDHIVPKSRGGSGDRSNGQLLCRLCNREKWDN